MTPDEFIRTWSDNPLSERASAQAHFIALCGLLGVEPPSPATAGSFEFEKGAAKTTGGDGWADVWLRDAFAWEYKKTKANLDAAYAQVQRYAPALDNPPLLIVSDTQRIVIRTAFTGAVQERHDIAIGDLRDADKRDLLRRAFQEPRSFRPKRTRADLTEDAAATFADLALRLRQAGHDAPVVAHFVNRLVFCMFAEDVRLLPEKMFEKMVFASDPGSFEENCRALFAAMASRGGRVGFTAIPWFNGGLFDDDTALPVDADDIAMLRKAAKMDWSQIDASLLGTLFERGLDPGKRSQLGAHYTDAAKIMQIVEPVVLRPLRAEWDAARAAIEAALEEERAAKQDAATTRAAAKAGAATRRANRAHDRAMKAHLGFLERLRGVRVLDPACGSGNFLNLTLTALKDLEHRANLDAEAMGLPRPAPSVGPECVLGIELSPYAAELARVSTWIAEIQWMRRNGFEASKDPILKPLGTIECRDAVLAEDGTAAAWPEAEFIVGNPPFLGNKRMIAELGEDYAKALRAAYPDVPGGVDLVAYWVAAAWRAVAAGRAARVGLVTTNSIRGGANRSVLAGPAEAGAIFEAWSDEPWTVAGAAVRVSMVMFGAEAEAPRLDGEAVGRIAADLTAGLDLTGAARLGENRGVAFMGDTKGGAFDVDGEIARRFLRARGNPNGKPNSDVVRPWANGMALTRRWPDKWIIDYGMGQFSLQEASLYEQPFEYLVVHVMDKRKAIQSKGYAKVWYEHERPRPALFEALGARLRYVATPRVAKHRLFVWTAKSVLPDSQLICVARDDDTTFGILHSRFHEAWSLRMGTSLEDRPRYTPSTTFETFPFPEGLTPDLPAAAYAADPRAQAIAAAARELDDKREAWLNPPDLVRRVPEVVEGYPDRLLPVDEAAATELKKRTLTNLYNARPAWLDGLHRRLDAAVAAAYGWPEDIAEDDALARLLELNRARA
ncbi:type II restriction/modification system DNA methylase subunit YeeA [Hasllibacter halocynthiae]|uniref:site-specific DNA-methyltransferase (adenine-specific) n=1 Tax=Hasllibacter halocynthiae TaxID=595589 RepID=A0A2T0WZF8_9RHOB|nr:DNA methyltransferase [Hasllibacter halocynthiae]PRY92070.1 type II restriction/modification system DNA methylase subunit YeeA [Hasllibacter halocynthiae]